MDNTNYKNLSQDEIYLGSIQYTGENGTINSLEYKNNAGMFCNTWSIVPSGDGNNLEFYHISNLMKPSLIINKCGSVIQPKSIMSNGHKIINYNGTNGFYDIDSNGNGTYSAYIVHGFGDEYEKLEPWIVIMATVGNAEDGLINFGQLNDSDNVYTVPITNPTNNVGNYIYGGFKNYKGANRIAIVTDNLEYTDDDGYRAFELVQDDEWRTGNYSLYDAIQAQSQVFKNDNKNYAGTNNQNRNILNRPSMYRATTQYSGIGYAGNLQLNRDNEVNKNLDYFFLYGINNSNNGDASVMAFSNSTGINNDWENNWKGDNQKGTKWSYWSSDFNVNSKTQRIGVQNETSVGAGLRQGEYGVNNSKNVFIIIK